jgi:hypothetical protein
MPHACLLALLLALPSCGTVPSAVPDDPGAIVTAAPASVPDPGSVRQETGGPPASPPLHITYPEAGMDIPVHAFVPDAASVASRSLIPPETMDGYWLSSLGSPGAGSTNTTYIMGHSWLGRDAPFNHLSTAASPGDRLTVRTAAGMLDYQVDSVATHTKATLNDSAIWDVVPNSVVLISCFTEDPWGKNVVVVASPVSAGR